jgi:hypothetical protein
MRYFIPEKFREFIGTRILDDQFKALFESLIQIHFVPLYLQTILDNYGSVLNP